MNEQSEEHGAVDKAPASDDLDTQLFDPFEQLFKVKPPEPGEYRRADDGRDF